MARNLGSAIKNKIVGTNQKYKSKQQKIGTVIEANTDSRVCTVSFVTRDGINSIKYKVPVRSDSTSGSSGWMPEKGNKVTIEEDNNRYVITGPYDEETSANSVTYDIYSSATASASGFLD